MELIQIRVFKPEMFVEFLKLIGPSMDRSVVFSFVKDGECLAQCHLTDRLENLFNFLE